jgi:hypothetical protein
MKYDDKTYVYETEEDISPYTGMQISENGNYLCVRWSEHPVYVYKLMQPGEQVHPYTCQFEYNGKTYRLDSIQDEKEHATSR